jgi:hypothetical protein
VIVAFDVARNARRDDSRARLSRGATNELDLDSEAAGGKVCEHAILVSFRWSLGTI